MTIYITLLRRINVGGKNVIRMAELEQLVLNCPFSEEEVAEAESSSEAESQYVSLLTQVPLREKIESLDTYRSENDKYRIIGRDLFLLFHHSIRNSKLANNLYKLGVPVTVRNWKTINRISALANAMEI